MRKKPRPGIRTDAGGGALFVTYVMRIPVIIGDYASQE